MCANEIWENIQENDRKWSVPHPIHFSAFSLELSRTLASCEIVLTKHNHLHQPQKIVFHDLMGHSNVNKATCTWAAKEWRDFCGSSTEFKPIHSMLTGQNGKSYIFLALGESDLLIWNRKESTIFFYNRQTLAPAVVFSFVLPLSFFPGRPVSWSSTGFQAHWRHSNRSINLAKQCVWSMRVIPSGEARKYTDTHTRMH